jgi:hypothetical protein
MAKRIWCCKRKQKVPVEGTVKLESATLSQQAVWTYRRLHEQISFLKGQQWSITNYVAVIYGAIFASTKVLIAADTVERYALIVGTLIAGAYGIILLVIVQSDLSKARIRLDETDRRIFGSSEYSQLGMKVEKHPFRRGHSFTIAMYLVLVGAGLFVLYYLLNLTVSDIAAFVPY